MDEIMLLTDIWVKPGFLFSVGKNNRNLAKSVVKRLFINGSVMKIALVITIMCEIYQLKLGNKSEHQDKESSDNFKSHWRWDLVDAAWLVSSLILTVLSTTLIIYKTATSRETLLFLIYWWPRIPIVAVSVSFLDQCSLKLSFSMYFYCFILKHFILEKFFWFHMDLYIRNYPFEIMLL